MLLIYGLVTGVLFGVLLQRAEVIRYDRQLGAMLLTDMTIVKFMLTAILVGMVGLAAVQDLGLTQATEIKALSLGPQIIGGLIFGVGWAVLGYCPGTSAGALGEGRTDALWGILGGVAGAAIYAEVYPQVKAGMDTWANFGKVTLPSVLGVNHWIVIVVLSALYLGIFVFFEKRGL